jgi:hypothetical protein
MQAERSSGEMVKAMIVARIFRIMKILYHKPDREAHPGETNHFHRT